MEERVFREYPINPMHKFKRPSIHANRRIIDRGTADREQLTLARQAQFCVVFADHLAAF